MSQSIRQSNLFSAEDYQKIFKAYSFIDYTAYDFDTLKQALINYIQAYYPEDFNDYIESSEFIAIIELIAYFGTSLAFRTDLNSRENFIDTAERRESIIRLAQMVNYVPSRNIAANGLFKIASVQTDQALTDANGVNLNNTTIYWADPNNPDWFDQFIQICNATFSNINPFGRPSKSGTIGSIPTDLYQLNNVINLNVTYPTIININGQSYPIDICNPDFVTNQTIFEKDPDPANAFSFIYRNDSLGVSSANTGFFLYFKQGTLVNVDANFDFPVPNRIFPIDIQNINNTDVYVQETDQSGAVINKWIKVPAIAGENIIYNSIQFAQRNIFSVITGANDTVSVRFADGNFGNVPTGLFRFWVRTSANQDLIIRPDSAQGLQISIPYVGIDNQQYTLTVTFNLEQTISNAAATETNEQIRLRAPEVFSTQSRMVNGSDYNVLPLIYGNQIVKLQSIDRTYSGQSRYIDLNDPTGFHRDLIIFGEDGALYRDNRNVLEQVIEDTSNTGTIAIILVNTIQEMLRSPYVSSFFYDEYLSQFESTIRVNPPDTGRSLLDLIPSQFIITAIDGDSATVTVNYIGPAIPVSADITISGVTGTTGYNGTYTVATSSDNILTFASATVGVGGVTNAILLVDPSLPLYWRTSPQKFKNTTGFFAAAPNSTTAEALTNSSLNPDNIQGGVYQPWAFIKSGAILELADTTTSVTFTKSLNPTAVRNVIQSGLPSVVGSLTKVGPVELGTEEQNNYQAVKVMPAFRSTLTDIELNGDGNTEPNGFRGIVNRISDGTSFWIYYDLLQDEWHTYANPGTAVDEPFLYAPPDIISMQEQIYSINNWTTTPRGGILYINRSVDIQTNNTIFDLTARGRVFVFESYRDVRFFWEPNQILIDNSTGLALQDTIEIMPFVNTNNSIDNNEPVITNPTDAFLKAQVSFNVTGVFTQDDGYVDTSKVEISLVDENNDGVPDFPDGFNDVVSPTDRLVFEYYTNEVAGYQSTRPWISRWGTTFENTITDLYVYFPVVTPGSSTTLYSDPYISAMFTADPVGAPPPDAVPLSTVDLIFLNTLSQLEFDDVTPIQSIANQVTAFFNLPVSHIDPIWIYTNTNYPWIIGTELVADKLDIVTTFFLDKTFLISSISPPGFGVYYSLDITTTTDPLFPSKIYELVDKYHFDKNGKSFTQNTNVLPSTERLPLYFKWSHYSPIDQRVDPSPTNIIDMIVITEGYYTDVINWKNRNGSAATFPKAPTTEDLRIQFQDLDQYKMVSDSMIWNSGQFKILFGTQSSPELQATFKVVKSSSTNISDNEIKTKVISAIDSYFDIRNWDFGEKFYYTELAAFIHQQLSTIISTVVIVPNSASSQFGNLFEIVAGPTELFISTATVNNVQIVSNLTEQNLRV